MKVFCAVTTLFLMSLCLPARADLEDGISAIVYDRIITINEVKESAAQAADVLQREYADQPEVFGQKYNATLNDSLETLIDNQLILHEFQSKYNPLPDSLVNEWVEERIKERFGDRSTCIRTLQAQGITFEKFRQQVRDNMVIEQLRLQKLSENKIIISPYKIETYYKAHQDEFKVGDQVQVRMIVINKISPDDTTARQKASEILGDLKKGSSFPDLASLYSQDPEQKGSDWIETSVLRKELADAAGALQPGETSGIVETSDECYILQLEGRRGAHVKPLNDVRGNIESTLRAQTQKDEERRWIDSLRKKAFVRYFAGVPE
jgi:peptidyl-prolyl cis-trans isomerase SurA